MDLSVDLISIATSPADRALVQRAVAGDESAFRKIVEQHGNAVFRYLLKHAVTVPEAEELTQEVFLQAFIGLGRFSGESRLRTWLIGIALNLVRNLINRTPGRLAESLTDREELADRHAEVDELGRAGICSPEDDLAYRQALRELDQRIAALPADSRDCLILIALEELTYEEVAALTHEPVGSVKSRVSRARRTLLNNMSRDSLNMLAGKFRV